MRAIRIAGGLVLVLVVALAAVILAGQRGLPVPPRSDYAIDLAKLHELAQGVPGAKPVALNALVLGRGQLPRGAIIAGATWLETTPRVFCAYQIVYEDGSTVVIDAPAAAGPGAASDPAAQAALEDAIASASSLLLTHTHDDHLLGLVRSSRYEELKSKLVLTRAQRDEPNFGIRSFPEGSLKDHEPLRYEGAHAFAPGLVLLAAPGHTLDSQIVYLELANGAQYLLLGDVVWDMENIRALTTRPRIVGNTLIRGDEAKVSQQIRALHDLVESAPVHLVISHDAAQLDEQIRSGLIGDGFRAAAASH